MKTVYVRIADLAALQGEGVLVTIGLGSCVGVALYDPKNKVAGLAHILLNSSIRYTKPSSNHFNPAKFADTAIPELIKVMLRLGASQKNLIAHIAGGSSLFNFKLDGTGIGEKNLVGVRTKLDELGITIRSDNSGGNYGRTMRLHACSGKVEISTVSKGEKKHVTIPAGPGL
ncbi:MAG: chemotaxis protein CheD [Firmicutes bacterium]|nr:chemotaxis protein CheD [Bacillota bacterium]